MNKPTPLRSINLRQLLARGPEIIRAETVRIKEIPLQEIVLTLAYIIFAGLWYLYWDDFREWALGVPLHSPALQVLKGVNFVFTTGILLYLVLRHTTRSRRLAEEGLRLSQQRFESVALATTDAIWDLNLETKVVWWSDGIQKLFGYSPGDVSSKLEWWLEHLHPEDRDLVMATLWKVAESGAATWSGSYRFQRKDNTYATVQDCGFIIHDVTGKAVRVVGGLRDITERSRAQEALQRSRQQLRALTNRLQRGREEERANIAREIHDELGQLLTAVKINLDWIEGKINERQQDASLNPLLDRVVESAEMTANAIQAVQRIATNLRPALLDELGLAEAMEAEVRRFQERSGLACELQLPGERMEVAAETATTIFRVLQEALTNVARHAHASKVRIVLGANAAQVSLQIEDDGQGIPWEVLEDPRSLGLLGMRERASMLGGDVAVNPVIPHGTRVSLSLPRTVKAKVPA